MTDRRLRRAVLGVVHLVVAVAVGGFLAHQVVTWDDERRDRAIASEQAEQAEFRAELVRRVEANDRLGTAVDELLADGVHVTPDGRSLLDEDGEREVEAAVAGAAVRMFVVVWSTGQHVGFERGLVYDALRATLVSRLDDGEQGVLYVWEGPEEGTVELFPGDGYVDPPYGSEHDFVGDPARHLVAAAGAVSPDDFYGYGEELGPREPYDDFGGLGGGIAAGLLLGGLVVLVVLGLGRMLAFGLGRRRLLPGGWGWGVLQPTRRQHQRKDRR